MFLTCVDIKNPRPLFLWWTLGHNESVFEHWFTYTTPLSLTHFKGIIKAFSGMYVRLTSITFPVIWWSVLISGLVFKCFRINNRAKMFVCPMPKRSPVMKWRRLASHLSRFTLWRNIHWTTQLCRFSWWHSGGREATQLSRFTLWHNGRCAKQSGLMNAPGVAQIFQWQWRTMLKNIKA